MTISVIIPVYQAEKYIKKAVISAYKQQEVSEVILVEDGSTDNSLHVCEQLITDYESKVKLYQHDDGLNHGAGASRNLGVLKASGEYIAFLDADDYYLPGRFKHDLEMLRSDSSIDGIYNALGTHVYDEEERDRVFLELTTVTYSLPPEKVFEEMAPIGNSGYFHGDTLTVRRKVFEKVGYFDEALELSQDTHMWVKMSAKILLVAGIIDRPVAIRGVHSGNRVKNIPKFEYYRPLLFLSLLKWAEKNNLPIDRKTLIWDKLYKVYHYQICAQKISVISKKIKIILFLFGHGVTRPYLIKHRKNLFLRMFSRQL